MDDVRVGLPLMATETVTKQVDISTLHMFSSLQQNMAGVLDLSALETVQKKTKRQIFVFAPSFVQKARTECKKIVLGQIFGKVKASDCAAGGK